MHRHSSLPRRGNPQLKKILVTGGCGYIGSALLPKLLTRGYEVRLLDKFIFGHEPLAAVLDHPKLEVQRGDFRQTGTVIEAMKDVDAVIHLGAIVGDPACAQDARYTTEVNLMGTRTVAEVAKSFGVNRMIFASTCSVYGASEEILDEHSTLNPVSLYACTKIAAEQLLMKMTDEHFTPVFLRFGTLYGFSGRTRFDLAVNIMTATAVVDGQINVYGGDQWRPFLHVDDAALAVATVLDAPLSRVGGQIFNVGSNEQNYRIREVGQIIQELNPHARLICHESADDLRNYRVDFSKINRILGFAPQWTLEEGVAQVSDAFAVGKISDYREPRYNNAKFMETDGIDTIDYANSGLLELLNQTIDSSHYGTCAETARIPAQPAEHL